MASPQEIAKIQSGDPGANVSTRQSIRQAILNETRRREALIKKINQLTAEAEAKANKKGGLASLRLKDIGTGKNLKRIGDNPLEFLSELSEGASFGLSKLFPQWQPIIEGINLGVQTLAPSVEEKARQDRVDVAGVYDELLGQLTSKDTDIEQAIEQQKLGISSAEDAAVQQAGFDALKLNFALDGFDPLMSLFGDKSAAADVLNEGKEGYLKMSEENIPGLAEGPENVYPGGISAEQYRQQPLVNVAEKAGPSSGFTERLGSMFGFQDVPLMPNVDKFFNNPLLKSLIRQTWPIGKQQLTGQRMYIDPPRFPKQQYRSPFYGGY